MKEKTPYIVVFLFIIALFILGLIFQELGYIVFLKESDTKTEEKKEIKKTSSYVGDIVRDKDVFAEPKVYIADKQKKVFIPTQSQFIEIIDSCGPYFEGACLNVRSGPGVEFESIKQLRTGIVLKVGEIVTNEIGEVWYKIVFDEWIRYPERVPENWYVSSEFVKTFEDTAILESEEGVINNSNKYILVDRSEQTLYAYEGETLFMQQAISSGLEFTPTPRGNFTIYKKIPSRYMQGPLPGISEKYYDLPGVPWNLYFTQQGAVIHGAYWHDKFGQSWSSGCVNVSTDKAKELYDWAEVGIRVIVRD